MYIQKPPWKLVQSRVELLDRFYHNVGFESSGIDFRVVMKVSSLLFIVYNRFINYVLVRHSPLYVKGDN